MLYLDSQFESIYINQFQDKNNIHDQAKEDNSVAEANESESTSMTKLITHNQDSNSTDQQQSSEVNMSENITDDNTTGTTNSTDTSNTTTNNLTGIYVSIKKLKRTNRNRPDETATTNPVNELITDDERDERDSSLSY